MLQLHTATHKICTKPIRNFWVTFRVLNWGEVWAPLPRPHIHNPNYETRGFSPDNKHERQSFSWTVVARSKWLYIKLPWQWRVCWIWQVFENLVELQKELSLSVQELMKLQKTYKEEEHITHDARIKAADADDKLVVVIG